MTDTLDLDTLHLNSGGHGNPAEGTCVMEAVAMLAGEPFSDHPACASPVIGAFLRSWNDALDDDTRQTLKRYIPRLVGSKGTPEQEERRSWMALDWLVRVQAPAWLRLAGLNAQADILANLTEVTADTCPSIRGPLQAVREDARAAGAAAWDAAWAAARAAARDAARDAARAAARDAAWDAARDAARAAARDAAWAALRPTTTELQGSAHELVDRMLAVTEGARLSRTGEARR